MHKKIRAREKNLVLFLINNKTTPFQNKKKRKRKGVEIFLKYVKKVNVGGDII